MKDRQQLIDTIYECSFVPELWPDVLDRLAQLSEARGGVLFLANPQRGVMRWAASESIRDSFGAYISDGSLAPKHERVLAARHAGFLTDADLFTHEELAAERSSTEVGPGWGAGTALTLPTGDSIGMGVQRDLARGPMEKNYVQQLDDLRPHLARGALLSARLHMERARAAAETLALIGLPALVLDDDGRVVAANSLIETVNSQIRWLARDRVSLVDASADAILQRALATLNVDEAAPPRSFALRGAAGAAFVAHVIPVRGAARDIFARSAGVLMLTPVTLPAAPPVELIQSLFDLTPAEARVARNLAAGETLEEIAVATGLTRNTIRSQLRGALDKTGSRRQAELVALLGGIAPWRK